MAAKKKNNNRKDRGKNRKAGNEPKLTAEQKRAQLAKELRIRPRTKNFVDKLIEDPSISQTQAWIDTHETDSRQNAAIAASKTLKKSNVQIYKDSAVSKAKKRIVELVDSNNESIAIKASTDILDRTQGKAVQRSESHEQRTVKVEMDLSGVRVGAHYIPAAQRTAIEE